MQNWSATLIIHFYFDGPIHFLWFGESFRAAPSLVSKWDFCSNTTDNLHALVFFSQGNFYLAKVCGILENIQTYFFFLCIFSLIKRKKRKNSVWEPEEEVRKLDVSDWNLSIYVNWIFLHVFIPWRQSSLCTWHIKAGNNLYTELFRLSFDYILREYFKIDITWRVGS